MSDSCCSGSCGCECSQSEPSTRILQVDLLYLDLSICGRCQGADEALEQAVNEVSAVLGQTGVKVEVNKIHVTSEEQARDLGFVSSPTIRVNGRDIQLDIRESLCESCGDLCGEDVDCRVWVWQGQEYTSPPKGMIIEALLREVYSNNQSTKPQTYGDVPDNLKRFFAARQKVQSN